MFVLYLLFFNRSAVLSGSLRFQQTCVPIFALLLILFFSR